MIVWGGSNGSSSSPLYLNNGARYRPSTDAWALLPLNNAPAPRDHHTACGRVPRWSSSAATTAPPA